MRRVAVTGMGGITALGHDWPTISAALRDGRTAVRAMRPDWDRFEGVNTRLAAPVLDFDLPDHWPRKKTRTMGRVARMAVAASERALADAGLLNDPVLTGGRAGAAFGSSFGSPDSVLGFYELKMSGKSRNLNATTYIQMMSHTALVNIGLFFGLTGRMIPTSNACASASQAIGFAAEAIRWGKADVMVAGGAEELDITDAAVFDTLFATSTRNDTPHLSPRPFDVDRDGLVIGEGAGALILEVPMPTATTSPSRSPVPWSRPCGWRWKMPASMPGPSAWSTATAPPPRAATSPRRRPPRRCSGRACRSIR